MGALCLPLFWYASLCLLSGFATILKRKRKLVALILMSYCECSVALPHHAEVWSAVCDCGITWSYSLFNKKDFQRLKITYHPLMICNNNSVVWPINILSLSSN